MSDYTPTIAEIINAWRYFRTENRDFDGDAEAEVRSWLAAHDAEVRAESAEAHERTKRGAKTLGEIVVRQVEDTLRWAGMEDQIGTDDPDQQLAWERCAEMPGRIAELEAELAEVRAGVVAEEPEWEYGYTSKWGTIAAPSQEDAERRAADHVRGIRDNRESGDLNYHGKVMKRIAASKPGEWVPVKQEGADDA